VQPKPWPLVINQNAIALPHWPRSQEWWNRFTPCWCTAIVRPDGTVAFDVNSTLPDGTRTEMGPAALRRQRQALARWLHTTLPEAFPEIYGTVARNERGAVTELNAVPRWTTDGRTERNGYPAGKEQAAESWAVRFTAPGIRATIGVDAYAAVTTRDDDGNPVEYSAEAMIRYTTCRDTADPDGTEVWSAIEYDTDRDSCPYGTAEDADKAAFRVALAYRDNPGHFAWNGSPGRDVSLAIAPLTNPARSSGSKPSGTPVPDGA